MILLYIFAEYINIIKDNEKDNHPGNSLAIEPISIFFHHSSKINICVFQFSKILRGFITLFRNDHKCYVSVSIYFWKKRLFISNFFRGYVPFTEISKDAIIKFRRATPKQLSKNFIVLKSAPDIPCSNRVQTNVTVNWNKRSPKIHAESVQGNFT